MHLLQAKRDSIRSGGPQYFLHGVPKDILRHLRAEKEVRVALVTPYGATPSDFVALAGDVKLSNGKLVPAHIGKERIQKADATGSIGEAIRDWYRLNSGDFERIDVEIQVIDEKFYLTPVGYKYAGPPKRRVISRPEFPLSFNGMIQSQLWRKQLERVKVTRPEMWQWSLQEICRVAEAHASAGGFLHVQEQDLLRASGPLKVLGVECGPYRGKGLDCEGRFQFLDYQPYTAPIEIKKASSGFKYQQVHYPSEKLSRVVILCVRHDLQNVPRNVDVIELNTLCSDLKH